MTSPGKTLLERGGDKEARTNLALKMFLIIESLYSSRLKRGGVAESSALRTVSQLNGEEVVTHASAFLNCMTHRLYESIVRAENIPDELFRLFLIELLDSYFLLLNDDDAIDLSGCGFGDIVLPVLGIRIHPGSGDLKVVRSSADRVTVRDRSKALTIRISEPGQYALLSIPVSASGKLLLSVDALLKDAMAEQQLAQLSAQEAADFASEIRKALALIQTADPSIAADINRMIRWYFPIRTPNKQKVHNSFSISTLHGAMFLSEAYSPLALVEAVVHEYYHNELWWLMTIDSHVNNREDLRLYSPWRPDPRPLVGLYHGIYVFAGLLQFYAAGQRKSELKEHHSQFRARRKSIYFQLRTALAQVPSSDLESRGKEVIRQVASIVEDHGKTMGLESSPVPERQRIHWREWSLRNNTYRQFATAPLGAEMMENSLA